MGNKIFATVIALLAAYLWLAILALLGFGFKSDPFLMIESVWNAFPTALSIGWAVVFMAWFGFFSGLVHDKEAYKHLPYIN